MGEDRYPLLLVFNAEGVDGRDPSWLYDVSFAPLRGRTVRSAWVNSLQVLTTLTRSVA